MSRADLAALVCAAAALVTFVGFVLARRLQLRVREELRLVRGYLRVAIYERNDLRADADWHRADAADARAALDRERQRHADFAVLDRNTEPLTDDQRDQLHDRFAEVLDGFDDPRGR